MSQSTVPTITMNIYHSFYLRFSEPVINPGHRNGFLWFPILKKQIYTRLEQEVQTVISTIKYVFYTYLNIMSVKTSSVLNEGGD